MSNFKLSEATHKKLNELEPSMKRAVEQRMAEYVKSCLKNNLPVTNLDNFVTEAIEVLIMEAREPKLEGPNRHEPGRDFSGHYENRYSD